MKCDDFHWSDCAVNNGPALEPGPCNCGALQDLTEDCLECGIIALVVAPGCIRLLIKHMSREGFIAPEQLPSRALAALTATADLPDAHRLIALIGKPDSMDFDDARKAVIAKLKALSEAQGLTSRSRMHDVSPVIATSETASDSKGESRH